MRRSFDGYPLVRTPRQWPVLSDAAPGDGADGLLLYALARGLLPSPLDGGMWRMQVYHAYAVPTMPMALGDEVAIPRDAPPVAPPAPLEPEPAHRHVAAPARETAARREMPPTIAGCRPLFREPGLERVVRFGDFRAQLERQLARPDLLRDSHQLPCHVQVFEAVRRSSVRALEAAIDADGSNPPRLQRLTDAATQLLRLGALPVLPPELQRREAGDVDELRPYDRVFRIDTALDPTANATRELQGEAAPRERSPIVAAVTDTPAPAQPSRAPATAGRTAVPEEYQRAWECRLTRDEAICDLTASATFGTGSSLLRRIVTALTGGGALRRWREGLRGRSLDGQLWGTRPPAGALTRDDVRAWAQRTLALAGYDPTVMLTEWEIFWRQRGV